MESAVEDVYRSSLAQDKNQVYFMDLDILNNLLLASGLVANHEFISELNSKCVVNLKYEITHL